MNLNIAKLFQIEKNSGGIHVLEVEILGIQNAFK